MTTWPSAIPFPTLDEALARAESPQWGTAIDGRDIARLLRFMPDTTAVRKLFGFEPKDPYNWEATPWHEASVLAQIHSDINFAFEKALNQRGMSASCMNSVLQMWCYLFEIENAPVGDDHYAQYGLPLCKFMAQTFGTEDKIAGKNGNEVEFSAGFNF